MDSNGHLTKQGALIVIRRPGDSERRIIAEVVEETPLVVKATEIGPLSLINQTADGFIVLEEDTRQFQQDGRDRTCHFLCGAQNAGQTVVSGLRRMGAMSRDQLLRVQPPEERHRSQEAWSCSVSR